MLLVTRGACSLPIQMRDEGSHFRILDRLCGSDIQFVLCGERKVIGAVDPIPLRERATLNVDGII
jgi:3-dehydroquinate dehydratase